LATIAQAAYSARIALGAARPDLLLIAVVCCAVLTSSTLGLAAGLCGGILMASMTGVDYGTFIASRMAAGWIGAAVPRALRRDSLITPVAAMAAATAAVQVICYAMAPGSLRYWAITSLGELIYNVALALPVFLVLRALIRPRRAREPYMRRLKRQGARL
jgi:rod shape-determining protein MreD